jgi:hypothetical protein
MRCGKYYVGVGSTLIAIFFPVIQSKEALHVIRRPPPRPVDAKSNRAVTVPLERMWKQLPHEVQSSLLSRLSSIVANRLALINKEQANE